MIAAELVHRAARRGLPEHEKRLHAVALNLDRRQLTEVQKVILGRKIAPDVEERARLRQIELGRELGGRPGPTLEDICPQGLDRGPQARDEVAALVGLASGRTYERNAAVLGHLEASDPDLYREAAAGSATLADVQRRRRRCSEPGRPRGSDRLRPAGSHQAR